MNQALLSSEKMDWCTPQDFYEELDAEFNFDLDPAATHKSAKCRNYFTPDEDGLSQEWGVTEYFAIHLMENKLPSGCVKDMKKVESQIQ